MTRAGWIAVAALVVLFGGLSFAALGWAFLAKSPADDKTQQNAQADKDLRQSRLDNARSNPPGPAAPDAAESLEIDVSARTIPITSAFKGTEIIVFGTVVGSRQEYAESGHYDVVVVVEGASSPVTVRRKSNIAGIWINASSVRLASLPAYYAILSTKPLIEIAAPELLAAQRIGIANVPMSLAAGVGSGLSEAEIAGYKQAVVRLKTGDGLYQLREDGVAFIGRSLFRSSVQLPANIPVGAVKANVHLFSDGRLLASREARVVLQREGVERVMHTFAYQYPFFYGVFAVVLAVLAGLLASFALQRKM